MIHIKAYKDDREKFDSLRFEGKNQQERFQAMMERYLELEAFYEANKGNPSNFEIKKQATIQDFLRNIPNSILFLKDGEYKGKKLRAYPGLVKKRLERLVDTLEDINQYLPENAKIKISAASCKTILNANWTSIKKAWDELEFEETDGINYMLYELNEMEKDYILGSEEYLIFETLINQ